MNLFISHVSRNIDFNFFEIRTFEIGKEKDFWNFEFLRGQRYLGKIFENRRRII